jgi:hypothetical protein
MTDEQRSPAARDLPDSPDPSPTVPIDPDPEEYLQPDGDEFDGGRGGVAPEFPGDERPAPDGVPESDVPPPPDDPGAAAVDDHVAGQPGEPGHQPVDNLDRGVEREHLNAPNQGFRPGG